jgi:hypothetical protein
MSFLDRNAYILLCKQKNISRKRSQQSSSDRLRANSPHITKIRRTTMTTFKILIGAALVSLATVTTASAQLPSWAVTNPDAYQAQYPNRDILNDGALTPAGRMGLEFAHGAAPAFGARHAYAAVRRAATSSTQRFEENR